ncbi:zinc transporter ZntB [Vibrio sp. 99-70-13A1]|uniref:zinc transporter ZntB n=1 Tax=Vibrio sp. 99-70-13A1 TaxID=2607601 RepID=UPI0014932B08|nr:zinc transporter ZntB [Vibrio sp. 99-70-13A1]NOH95798.1 zinc transporter ZntB [Vibrio sp. 99-70-13A1]
MSQFVYSEKEPSGFIHAMLLDGSGGSQQLSWSEVNGLSCEQLGLWLHFDYSDIEAQNWIRDCSGLNEIAVDGLLSPENRPHALTRDNNLLLVLRGVNLNRGENPEDMVSVRVWANGKTLISTRKRVLTSTQDVLASLEDKSGPISTSGLLVCWADRIVTRMNDTINLLEDNVSEIEEALFVDEPSELRSTLLRVKQQCVGIRRYIAPQREALNKLVLEPLNWLDDIDRLALRSIADKQVRYVEDVDTIKERATMVKEELLSRVSEQLNNRSYVLTVVAAIFLPLGFFTGLMGVNVGGMPGIENGAAFWIVVGICVGCTGLLGAYFYWKKWF